ncbi:uncharacterized protein LOC128039908 [Gossypium raimondii]|uniref:uncharacterized protein LOC128039908 n=1 Tax=Gossypium raimondii TaxID=29730 RepID=UPI002279FD86|nr:uncharacterized protein LOC128039908 [Gossypium raimondii]
MDFISGLPINFTKKDFIWVIMDRLTKSAHFILVRMNYSLQKLAKLYISEIVRFHGVLVLTNSDWDTRFTFRFWKKLHKALGSKLEFSTAFHPQTDGQSERGIQILNSQSSIQMEPSGALYGHKCRTPLCWTELGERRVFGPELVCKTEDKVTLIQDHLKATSYRQKYYADLKWRDIQYFVVISFSLKYLRGRKFGGLVVRLVFETEDKVRLIWDRLKAASNRQKSYANLKRRDIKYSMRDFVFLKLPLELDRIYGVFHVSMLKRYRSDTSHVVSIEEIEVRPYLTIEEE